MESNTLQNWQYKILHILLNIIQYSCIFAVHIHELIYLFIPHVWCYVQSNWVHLCTVKECAQSHSCLWSFMNNLGRETIFRNQNEGENGFSVVLWGFSWGGGLISKLKVYLQLWELNPRPHTLQRSVMLFLSPLSGPATKCIKSFHSSRTEMEN